MACLRADAGASVRSEDYECCLHCCAQEERLVERESESERERERERARARERERASEREREREREKDFGEEGLEGGGKERERERERETLGRKSLRGDETYAPTFLGATGMASI